ncbi:MAG: dihydrolipoamide acetyltransferase family protein [Nannocystaceae bacterium]
MATVVELPRLTDTMEEGVIARWLIAEGDKVKRGQVIAEIETDKATMEFESFDAGYVLKLIAPEGETLGLGAPIAVLGKKGEDPAAALEGLGGKAPAKAKEPEAEPAEADDAEAEDAEAEEAEAPAEDAAEAEAEEAKPAKAKPAKAKPAKAKTPAPKQERGDDERIPASPLARRLARENDLALAEIDGSGPHGRVVKADVLRAIESAGERAVAAVAAPGATASGEADAIGRPFVSFEDRVVKLTPMRKTIAKRMTQSKRDIPHINLTIPIFMDRAAAMRTELNAALDGVKISFNDIIVYAVAKALRIHPRVNAAYSDEGLVERGDVHVGIAIAVDGGLIVPPVRFTDQKTIKRISLDIRDLGKRARNKSLKPDEMTGSTFTVSNLGMFGIESFTAVVNPGEAAILAVGAITDEVVAVDGQVGIRKMMRATLCSDHRVFDGADNARFLATLKKLLEAPMALFT